MHGIHSERFPRKKCALFGMVILMASAKKTLCHIGQNCMAPIQWVGRQARFVRPILAGGIDKESCVLNFAC